MKVLLAIDSFKGTFSSKQVEERLASRLAQKGIDAICVPISDGGEGLLEALAPAIGGQIVSLVVTGPDGDKVTASYLLSGDVAVVEMAQAAGITLSKLHSAAYTTTYGVGEIVLDALSQGATRIYMGLGGSATCDGGCGMAAALGWVFEDEDGNAFVPTGRTLSRIARIKRGMSCPIVALSDVTNPLYGAEGAAYVFAPQKGVKEGDLEALDLGLYHLAETFVKEGIGYINVPSAGAAGGLGGMIVALGGRLDRGIDRVLDLARFDRLVGDCDYVVTGEGRLDSQSLRGKVIDGVLSRKGSAKALALVGSCLLDAPAFYGLEKVFETNPRHLPFGELTDLKGDMDRAIDEVVTYLEERV